MKRLAPLIAFLLIPMLSQAQTVENFKLPKNYSGRLDEILPEVGLDLNVRFIFDKDYLKQYSTVLMTDQEKTVGGMLKMFRASWDLITLVGNDGFIYIARDKVQLELLQNHKEIVKTEITQSRKKLKPVKRNFLLSGEEANKVADISMRIKNWVIFFFIFNTAFKISVDRLEKLYN